MKEKIKNYKNIIILTLISIPIGIIIGAIDAVFGITLLKITQIRDLNPGRYLPFLSIAGIFIVYNYITYGSKSIKGMNLIFEVGHQEEEIIPPILIPFITIGTWITHLFGGSAGREGVAIQIGATVSNYAERKFKIKDNNSILLVTGMAAGFSGLFQTPIAAVMFAMEVLTAGSLEYKALLPAMIGSIVSEKTSKYFGLSKFQVPIQINEILDSKTIIKLIILGLVFALVGGLFAIGLKYTKEKLSNLIKDPIKRIFILGLILSILLYVIQKGRYCGLGTNLINYSLTNKTIYKYDWILKLIFTILTLSAGYQGGEVTPLFSIGASLGAVIGPIINIPSIQSAALGYAAVFSSATNTFLAPVFIGAEVFGYENLPYFFIVCAISYMFNMNKSIYTKQKIHTSCKIKKAK